MDPYIGEIRMFAGNYAPEGWALCNGQLLPVDQYDVLFSLLGTTYGGDGVTTFRVPDLQGRIPIHQGQGAGLTKRVIGQSFGTETVALTAAQVPHNHAFMAGAGEGTSADPAGKVLGQSSGTVQLYNAAASAAVTLNNATVTVAGQGAAHENIMPSLCVNFIISCTGIYPPRN